MGVDPCPELEKDLGDPAVAGGGGLHEGCVPVLVVVLNVSTSFQQHTDNLEQLVVVMLVSLKQACRNPGMLESRVSARCDICRQFYHMTKNVWKMESS